MRILFAENFIPSLIESAQADAKRKSITSSRDQKIMLQPFQ